MEIDLRLLKQMITKRTDDIERIVAGTGYLAKTVIGVGTFLLDNEGDYDLLTTKQKATFDRFLQPLLDTRRREGLSVKDQLEVKSMGATPPQAREKLP